MPGRQAQKGTTGGLLLSQRVCPNEIPDEEALIDKSTCRGFALLYFPQKHFWVPLSPEACDKFLHNDVAEL